MGIEPTSSEWKSEIIAIIIYLHKNFHYGGLGVTRTLNKPVMSRRLYQLSYESTTIQDAFFIIFVCYQFNTKLYFHTVTGFEPVLQVFKTMINLLFCCMRLL